MQIDVVVSRESARRELASVRSTNDDWRNRLSSSFFFCTHISCDKAHTYVPNEHTILEPYCVARVLLDSLGPPRATCLRSSVWHRAWNLWEICHFVAVTDGQNWIVYQTTPLHFHRNPQVLVMAKLERGLWVDCLETGGLTVRCKICVIKIFIFVNKLLCRRLSHLSHRNSTKSSRS